MDLSPRFYALSAFTPVAIEPVIRELAPVPEEFPREYFIRAETQFGSELESDPVLRALYVTAFSLSADQYGMPPWAQFWPPQVDLQKVLSKAPWASTVEGLEGFVRARYPAADELLEFAAMAWIRSQYLVLRDYYTAVETRYYLGKRLLAELPVVDRLLSQRLEESGYRNNLSDEEWTLVVGELALRVKPQNQAETVADLPVKAFVAGLNQAPASLWEDSVKAAGTGKGFFCLLGQLFNGVKEPLPEAISRKRVPSVFAKGQVRPVLADEGFESAISNYILEQMGLGSLSPKELKFYRGLMSRIREDSRFMEMVSFEAARLLVLDYMQGVVHYGFVNGFLERRSGSGVGSLRTHQRNYATAFVCTLEEVFTEDLGDSVLMVGSGVFRMAVRKLWSLFVAVRGEPAFGLAQDWNRYRTLADAFTETFNRMPPLEGSMEGERGMDMKALFSEPNLP